MLACGITYGFIALATPQSVAFITNKELESQTEELVQALGDSTFADCTPLLEAFSKKTGADAVLHDMNGENPDLPDIGEAQISDFEDYVEYNNSGTNQEIDASVSIHGADTISREIRFQDSDKVYMLMILQRMTEANYTALAMGQVFPYLLVIILVISLLGALIYSRYITRPIVRLSAISQHMADMDFTYQCNEQRIDEIGILGNNLDRLSANLSSTIEELEQANKSLRQDIEHERDLERQRMAFFSAASHELKTPITILQGLLKGMLEGVGVYKDRETYLVKALEAANRMQSLVREILEISRMDRIGIQPHAEDVELSALAAVCVEQARPLAEQRNIMVQTEIQPDIIIYGSGALLERAMDNLLSNAITYSPEGGRVDVRLSASRDAVTLRIFNSGIALPEDAIPHLFEAFYLVDNSRNRATGGSGLGLYLVKTIFDRSDATCEISNTEGGVQAIVRFSTQTP